MGRVTTGHVRLRRWCGAIAVVPLAACGTSRNNAEDRTILRPEQSEDFEIPADAVLVSLNGSLAKRVSSDSARAEYVTAHNKRVIIESIGDPASVLMGPAGWNDGVQPEDGFRDLEREVIDAGLKGEAAAEFIAMNSVKIETLERRSVADAARVTVTNSVPTERSQFTDILNSLVYVSAPTATMIADLEGRMPLMDVDGHPPRVERASTTIGGRVLKRQLISVGSEVMVAGEIDGWESDAGTTWSAGMHFSGFGQLAEAYEFIDASCALFFATADLRYWGRNVTVARSRDPALGGVWNLVCGPTEDAEVVAKTPDGDTSLGSFRDIIDTSNGEY